MQARLGCNSELILDEFGAKLLEELDYQQEARNIEVDLPLCIAPTHTIILIKLDSVPLSINTGDLCVVITRCSLCRLPGLLPVQDFGNNYAGDTKVKIPWVRRDLSGARILVMEWIDGMRCTNIRGIQTSGIDVNEFIRCGVVSGLRQLLEVSSRAAAQLPF